MIEKFTLNAQTRSEVGKGASRRLRNGDKIPGIVYGAHKEPASITVVHRELARALENEAFYSHILTLKIDDKSEKVILKDLQRHPFKPRITHIDLQRISEKEAITMRVPLHFHGGDVAPGVKIGGGIISHMQSEVSIRCLPANLPEYIDVDLSHLELNAGVYLSDLKLPKDVELVDLAHGGEDRAVAMVYIPRAATETVETAAAAPAEGEAAAAPAAEGKEKGAAAENKPAAGKPAAAKPAGGKEKGK